MEGIFINNECFTEYSMESVNLRGIIVFIEIGRIKFFIFVFI